jgi:hypothetical protein
MTDDGWHDAIRRAAHDRVLLDRLAQLLTEQDAAKEDLRRLGYGVTGTPWPLVIQEIANLGRRSVHAHVWLLYLLTDSNDPTPTCLGAWSTRELAERERDRLLAIPGGHIDTPTLLEIEDHPLDTPWSSTRFP